MWCHHNEYGMFAFSGWIFVQLLWQLHKNHARIQVIPLNTLRWRQNGCHVTDYIFNLIFLVRKLLYFDSNFKGPFNNNSTLTQIMAWRPTSAKPFSEPVMADRLLMHLCITGPHWVKLDEHWEICDGRIIIINSVEQVKIIPNVNGIVQERHNSSVLAMELRLSYTNPLMWNFKHKISKWFLCLISSKFRQLVHLDVFPLGSNWCGVKMG